MSEVEITRMSSKGQVVIPQDIREEMGLKEGEAFAVTGGGDTLLLRKIHTPSKEELLKKLGEFAREGQKTAKKLGIRESDVPKLIHLGRGVKK